MSLLTAIANVGPLDPTTAFTVVIIYNSPFMKFILPTAVMWKIQEVWTF